MCAHENTPIREGMGTVVSVGFGMCGCYDQAAAQKELLPSNRHWPRADLLCRLRFVVGCINPAGTRSVSGRDQCGAYDILEAQAATLTEHGD